MNTLDPSYAHFASDASDEWDLYHDELEGRSYFIIFLSMKTGPFMSLFSLHTHLVSVNGS
jgi:hypothetical protein